MEQAVITRPGGVAAGVFAPGHIGELTRIVPFEMVDAVLTQTGTVQRRVRLVSARVTVYVLLAGVLFTGLGYRQVSTGGRFRPDVQRTSRSAPVAARLFSSAEAAKFRSPSSSIPARRSTAAHAVRTVLTGIRW